MAFIIANLLNIFLGMIFCYYIHKHNYLSLSYSVKGFCIFQYFMEFILRYIYQFHIISIKLYLFFIVIQTYQVSFQMPMLLVHKSTQLLLLNFLICYHQIKSYKVPDFQVLMNSFQLSSSPFKLFLIKIQISNLVNLKN